MQWYCRVSMILMLCCSIGTGNSSLSSPKRLEVAVIDTGLNLDDPRFADVLCPTGHKDFTGEGISDRIGHGTHVAGIIKDAAFDHTKYCLVIVKVFRGYKSEWRPYLEGLNYVSTHKYPLANLSLSGNTGSEEEKSLIAHAGILVAAAGNDSKDYRTSYPGGYNLPNVRVVGNWDCIKNKKNVSSNYGDKVIWRCGTSIKSTLPGGKQGYMSGSSMAAPLYTAELINQMTKEK